MASHHNCQILFTRRELLGPAHIKGEEITQGMNIRRQGSLGATLEAAWHTGYIPQKFSKDQFNKDEAVQHCMQNNCRQLKWPSMGKQMRRERVINKYGRISWGKKKVNQIYFTATWIHFRNLLLSIKKVIKNQLSAHLFKFNPSITLFIFKEFMGSRHTWYNWWWEKGMGTINYMNQDQHATEMSKINLILWI